MTQSQASLRRGFPMEIEAERTSATSGRSIATIFKIIWHTATSTACLEYPYEKVYKQGRPYRGISYALMSLSPARSKACAFAIVNDTCFFPPMGARFIRQGGNIRYYSADVFDITLRTSVIS